MVSLVLLCLSRAYYAIDTMQDGFRKLKAKILENIRAYYMLNHRIRCIHMHGRTVRLAGKSADN